MLSTIFVSAGSMLGAIREAGEIGCLIIDEAGQAAPQMALGSLFRCRRAIVVGDPKQVEPVVTDELDLIKRVIQSEYTGCYQAKNFSVQGFADRLNLVRTTYIGQERNSWVGCPLVVHRRCISPMFEISNALSYDNMMKQQTIPPNSEKEASFCRESSGWINVSGSENSMGTYLESLSVKLTEEIFLLGCDENALFAVRWVNTNIVNVAVTRAKYRLYVIGDYTVWQYSDLFQKVKEILDSYTFRTL